MLKSQSRHVHDFAHQGKSLEYQLMYQGMCDCGAVCYGSLDGVHVLESKEN